MLSDISQRQRDKYVAYLCEAAGTITFRNRQQKRVCQGVGVGNQCLTARTHREYNIMKSMYLVPNSGAPVVAISASEPPFVSDGCYKEVA